MQDMDYFVNATCRLNGGPNASVYLGDLSVGIFNDPVRDCAYRSGKKSETAGKSVIDSSGLGRSVQHIGTGLPWLGRVSPGPKPPRPNTVQEQETSDEARLPAERETVLM